MTISGGGLSDCREIWMHPEDYEPCQQFEKTAHSEGIQIIRYASVHDPDRSPNAAILNCEDFTVSSPTQI
ncbi:MAG: RES family NAD+ phosphorylase [Aestuariivita sp.]|nr:RES family NAD+ phosphorylase [Aestuariivita sp.]MCY4202182.1 RES family NAD+ phosphorylase [Aestuariivita sp.]